MTVDAPPFSDHDYLSLAPASPSTGRRWVWVAVALAVFVPVIGAAVNATLLHPVAGTFEVPSDAMVPTFRAGDHVAVRPVRGDDLQPGDVVTFAAPTDGEGTELSRIVATGPAMVVIRDGRVLVDGRRLDERYLPSDARTEAVVKGLRCSAVEPCLVPADAVWVLGDNRARAIDSRRFGALPRSRVEGRVATTAATGR